ncbi:hypothetical protein chiPu_0015804 [Chiloscyllium punctatum]|uniref:Uncharacterized protein n=1 Tax=Chiloscyllium punctatum TaxID=137246 RepID=A0A401T3S2_CHIPU|nr:hypothetical protein [Chiloscyllium punctatum]
MSSEGERPQPADSEGGQTATAPGEQAADKGHVSQPSGTRTSPDGDAAISLGLNPPVPIRGIRMKFAVLSSLMQAGEVTNRDMVETIFNLVPNFKL